MNTKGTGMFPCGLRGKEHTQGGGQDVYFRPGNEPYHKKIGIRSGSRDNGPYTPGNTADGGGCDP